MILKLEINEMQKKKQTLIEQVKYLVKRPLVMIIVLNFSLSMGTINTMGSLNPETFSRFGKKEVSLKHCLLVF